MLTLRKIIGKKRLKLKLKKDKIEIKKMILSIIK